MPRATHFVILITVLVACQTETAVSSMVWDNWRGPEGRAWAPRGNPPLRWSEQENILFKTALPGAGGSSPIVWGDLIYLTTAIETSQTGTPPVLPDPGQRRFAGPTPTRRHDFVLLAIDRHSGAIRWRRTVCSAVPHEGLHNSTTQVAASPITDGEQLYVDLGSRGLFCLDMDGEPVWSKHFGYMHTRREWGEGASPALFGDTLVVKWDHEGDSFVVALDKHTGAERWRRARDEVTSWSTPLIVEVAGRAQVILAATTASRGYDLLTGAEVWSCRGMTVNCIPTPVHRDGLVYLMSGYRGKMLQAVRLDGAAGDITGSAQVVWEHRQSTSYVPSALLCHGLLFFLRGNTAVLSCLDAATGEVHYAGQRLRGLRNIYASPVGVGDRFYVTDRKGTTMVVRVGREFEALATNHLDDTFDASPAIVGDRIYLRGRHTLYAIAASPTD